ncbi:MAG TPA: DUF58 domain-containing protein [Candidatus Limnocylindria bacterium]|nr:DUF58 domain-containing protein [Candidatus Limnocylindria bacterium]
MTGWLALAAALVATGAAANAPGLVVVAAIAAGYATLTRLWTRFGARNVSYERRLGASRAVAGDSVALDITVWNRKPLPLPWIAVDDLLTEGLTVRERPDLDHADERQHRRLLRNTWALTWFERVIRHFHLDDVRRGAYELGPARLRIRDLFGRDAADDEVEGRTTLTVVPRSVPVTQVPTDRAPLGERRAPSSLVADPALFSGVRPFQAGDGLRRVHWRATARLGAPVSRRYEPARGRTVVIAVDVQTLDDVAHWEMAYDDDAFETLCVVAASLARRYLDDGASVGIAAASFTGTPQRIAWLAPRAGMGQVARVGELLARIGPVSSMPFGALLAWLARRLPSGATVVALSARDARVVAPVLRRLGRSGFAVEAIGVASTWSGDALGFPVHAAHLTPDWQHPDGLRLS